MLRSLLLIPALAFLTQCNGSLDPGFGGAVNTRVETFIADAAFPVSLAFAPDGRLFYTELRTGNIRIVQGGQLLTQPFATLPVAINGEQGLLGLALDPGFAANGFVYVYHTHPSPLRNRVVRFTDTNNTGGNLTVIVDNLPVNTTHNGGRVRFGADGFLYVTIGDAGSPANSQTTASVAGKLLRYTPAGGIPAGNPVAGNPMFAMGLRNPFGLAFHRTAGTPYVSDNGPNCDDEVNRIVSGGNYGWRPSYPCGDTDTQFLPPVMRFNPVIAPTGMVFYQGSVFPEWNNNLFLTSFLDGRLTRFVVNESAGGTITSQQVIINGAFGALIDVTVGNDGNLYVASDTAILRVVRVP